MFKNPARAFALVNLAIFALIIAAVLWLRDTTEDPGASSARAPAALEDTVGSVADTLSPDDVEPASTAQIDFVNELLTDTSFTVRRAFVLRSLHDDEAYYLGAEIGGADSPRPEMALWFMQGPRDQPRSVQAVNDPAAQYSVVGRTPSPGVDAAAATRILDQHLSTTGSS